MRRFILLCLLMFTVSSVVFAQRMTDEQVIQYVQEAQQAGKSQQQVLKKSESANIFRASMRTLPL